ncbi:acyl-CoA dehydrogenase family protein [Streptomyces sp. NPDC002088]|uniref:acyl-CoA dehydrogenase family protein n=1 Tax=Streptomyces sp. NPDC002088 TaxID=3154665 RepID=UPI00332A6569
MDFELDDEQAMPRTVSRDWLHDHAPTQTLRAQTCQQEDVDPALWRLAAERGRLGLGLPEEHGGTGQGLVELALVAQEIGRAAARGPFLPTALVGRGRGAPLSASTGRAHRRRAHRPRRTGRHGPWHRTAVAATHRARGPVRADVRSSSC